MEALKLRYLKAVPVLILSILFLVPAILLLNFKKVRKCLLYSHCDFAEADHLYVEAYDGNFDLCRITQC